MNWLVMFTILRFNLENWIEQSQKSFKKNADNDYDFVIKEYLLKK